MDKPSFARDMRILQIPCFSAPTFPSVPLPYPPPSGTIGSDVSRVSRVDPWCPWWSRAERATVLCPALVVEIPSDVHSATPRVSCFFLRLCPMAPCLSPLPSASGLSKTLMSQVSFLDAGVHGGGPSACRDGRRGERGSPGRQGAAKKSKRRDDVGG